jgi:hypothetical protein
LKEEDQDELPAQISRLYDQIKKAFDGDANILAGMGLRALVEAICLQQGITGNRLVDKINNLQAAGLPSRKAYP